MANDTQPSQVRVNEMLTQQAAQIAQQDFPRYKRQLIGWAFIGYLLVFLLIFLFLGILGGIAALAYFGPALLVLLLKKKLIFILIPAIWLLFRAIWVKLDPPAGLRLRRRDFPALYNELDQVAKRLDAPKVHQVVISEEFNAAICQTPRLGILGWQKNTLVLGLELLMILPTEQARAVIAHELGHLSGNHSKFNAWIYRVRTMWLRIMYSFSEQQGIAAKMMTKFFNWYAPRFAAYSYPLAQINEYEADKIAAELTNAQATADALINTTANAPYVDKHYWSNFSKKAESQPEPSLPWHGLQQFIQQHAIDRAQLEQNLAKILKRQTSIEDTHPSLSDRLKALNINAKLPADQDDNAADFWLGEQLDAIISDFDQVWLSNNTAAWQQRYQQACESQQQLQQLRQADIESLELEQIKQLSKLENEFGEPAQAETLLEHFHQLHPKDEDIAFALGEIRFHQDNEQALELFKLAAKSLTLGLPACQYAYDYLMSHNRREESLWWQEQAEQLEIHHQNALLERQYLADDAKIKPTDLNEAYIAKLTAKIHASGKVKKVWLVERELNYLPEDKCLIFIYTTKGFAWSETSFDEKILQQLEDLEYSVFIVNKKHGGKLVKNAIKIGKQIL